MVNLGLLRAIVAHDNEYLPHKALHALPWKATWISLSRRTPLPELPAGEVDLFVLLIDARTGVSESMISTWNFYQERQFPRLILVQGIEATSTDFDDIVLIANRILESVATPYLVLHDDGGAPSGLIELETGLVSDYSAGEPTTRPADPELLNLVAEFRAEYETNFATLGSDAFSAGLMAVALPIGSEHELGVRELSGYLQLLSKR